MATRTRTSLPERDVDLVIVGGGPTGLACAIEAGRRGLSCLVLERGTLVNTIVGYPTNTRFFSTAERIAIGGIPFPSVEFRPTRAEAIAYYRGVTEAEDLPIVLGCEVEEVTRSDGHFDVKTTLGSIGARFVVIATGYFDQTNRLDAPGEDIHDVRYYYDEPYRWYRRPVLVIGGRNSAVEAALDLHRNGADVTLVHRGAELGRSVKYWLRPDIENRIAEGSIRAFFETEVKRFDRTGALLRSRHLPDPVRIEVDVAFAMIGYRPDVDFLGRCGVTWDRETLVPTHDPVTFETNVAGLFLAGSVACGAKTWEIFIENGREHAAIVVEEIDRRTA